MTAPLATPLILVSDVSPKLASSGNAVTKTAILDKIVEESQRLQDWCVRRFDERIDTRYYTPRDISCGGDISGLDLFLGDDLKSLTTLTNGDGQAIASNDYALLPKAANQHGVTARSRIHLNNRSGLYWSAGSNDPEESISVLGTWGWGGQWKATGVTAGEDIDLTETAIDVSSGTSLEAGMTLKIDSEYLYIESISSNTATVSRAVNGSTAATHTNGTAFSRWEAHPLVRRNVNRLVLISIAQDKAPLFDRLILADAAVPVASDGNPRDVQFDVFKAGLRRATMPMGV